MPKYMEPLEARYEEEFMPVLEGDQVDHDSVLQSYQTLDTTGLEIIGSVADKWRNKAIANVSEVLLKATVQVQDADEAGKIVPPLTDAEKSMLKGKYVSVASTAELANEKKPKQQKPTDTRRVDTDKPKK